MWPQEGLDVKVEKDSMNINRDFQTLIFDVQGSLGLIKINRPKQYNALNAQVLTELKDLLEIIQSQNDHFALRGLILTGEGEKAFIAGADIKEMVPMTPVLAQEFSKLGQSVTLCMEALNVPIIACVDGFALGGGCEMAMACDYILATSRSVFGQPEAKLGLVPGFGASQRLPRLIGINRAKEWLYSGASYSASKACDWGLVNEVFNTKEEMLKAAKDRIDQIACNGPFSIKQCKQLINQGVDLTISEGLDLESDGFKHVFFTEDMKEGTQAFIEKRQAQFKGR